MRLFYIFFSFFIAPAYQACEGYIVSVISSIHPYIKVCVSFALNGIGRFFPSCLKEKKLLCLPLCAPPHQAPSEKGFTLRGKNLISWGANSFLLD